MKSPFFISFALVLVISLVHRTQAQGDTILTQDVSITVKDITGIGVTNRTENGVGVVRRDPSDVIKIDGQFFVFYTRSIHSDYSTYGGGNIFIGGGYYSTVWYATSTDGMDWTERGEAIGRGQAGKFDSNSAFTPNVVQAPDGEIYVAYTGVPLGFKNNNTTDFTNIGMTKLTFDADGDLAGSTQLNSGDPILENTQGQTSEGKPLFDSYRVDDASFLVKDFDGDSDLDIGLYYKGRAQGGAPSGTKMGLAIADSITGTFTRDANSENGKVAQGAGHEVMVFRYEEGVISMVTNVGKGVYYDEEGVDFLKIATFNGKIAAPGAYRPELVDPSYTGGVEWGISMVHAGDTPYLVRWEAEGLAVSEPTSLLTLAAPSLQLALRRPAPSDVKRCNQQ